MNVIDLPGARDSACRLNPLIGNTNALDTMESVSAVITYLTEVQTLAGLIPSEKGGNGKALILQMCNDALMFELNADKEVSHV